MIGHLLSPRKKVLLHRLLRLQRRIDARRRVRHRPSDASPSTSSATGPSRSCSRRSWSTPTFWRPDAVAPTADGRADDLRRRAGAAGLPDAGRGRPRPRRRRRHRRGQPVVEADQDSSAGVDIPPNVDGPRRSTTSTCASSTPTPRSSSCRWRRPTSRPASRRSSRRWRWARRSCARARPARPTPSSTARTASRSARRRPDRAAGGDRPAARRPGARRRGSGGPDAGGRSITPSVPRRYAERLRRRSISDGRQPSEARSSATRASAGRRGSATAALAGASSSRMNRAGTPPTSALSATELVTTAPAATIVPAPIVTPGRIVEPAPIHAPEPISTGSATLPAGPPDGAPISWRRRDDARRRGRCGRGRRSVIGADVSSRQPSLRKQSTPVVQRFGGRRAPGDPHPPADRRAGADLQPAEPQDADPDAAEAQRREHVVDPQGEREPERTSPELVDDTWRTVAHATSSTTALLTRGPARAR